MSVKNAFEKILSLHKRTMRLERGDLHIQVDVSPSNYARNLAGPSDIIIAGHEFVMAKNQLKSPIAILKRGDVLVDPELGNMAIDEIVVMYSIGGEIIGYRCRTN